MPASELNLKLIDVWQEAANDLGVRVTAPIEYRDSDGSIFQCEALVHDFGSPFGATVVSEKTERRIRNQIRNQADKMWVSIVFDRKVASYERRHFIDVLNDWGWFGDPIDAPEWYSGEPWS